MYNNAAGVERVHDVSEQVAFRMLSGQRALLSRGDHFSQRTHPGKARLCRNSSFVQVLWLNWLSLVQALNYSKDSSMMHASMLVTYLPDVGVTIDQLLFKE